MKTMNMMNRAVRLSVVLGLGFAALIAMATAARRGTAPNPHFAIRRGELSPRIRRPRIRSEFYADLQSVHRHAERTWLGTWLRTVPDARFDPWRADELHQHLQRLAGLHRNGEQRCHLERLCIQRAMERQLLRWAAKWCCRLRRADRHFYGVPESRRFRCAEPEQKRCSAFFIGMPVTEQEVSDFDVSAGPASAGLRIAPACDRQKLAFGLRARCRCSGARSTTAAGAAVRSREVTDRTRSLAAL